MKKVVFLLFVFTSILTHSFGENAIDFYREGKKALAIGKINSAIESFKASLRINPNYYKPMKGLARCFFLMGQYEEALNYVKKAEKYNSGNIELLTLEGEIRIGLGDFERAREIFNSILEKEPNNVNARFGLAELDIANGQKSAAAKRYIETLKIAPENQRALLSLALIYDKLGQREISNKYLELALRYHSDNPKVHLVAARHLMEEGKYNVAMRHLKIALSLNPSFLDALIAITELYIIEKDYSDAVLYAKKIIAENRTHELGWYLLGLAYKNMGDMSNAINSFLSLLNIHPEDEIARIVLENIVIPDEMSSNKKNTKNKEIVSVRQQLSNYHYERGKLLESRNYIETAKEEYRRALILKPDSKAARLSFAKIFKMQGYPIKYLTELKVLRNLGYSDTYINDEIEIYSNLDNESIAKKWGVNQYALDRERYNIALIMLKSESDSTEKFHPFFERDFIKYFGDFISSFDNVNIVKESIVENFSEAFGVARKAEVDYFIVLQYEELERSFSVYADVYFSGTGSKLRSFEEYRTGNDRVRDAVISITRKLDSILPLRGRIVKKEFNRGLIDLGAMDGVKKDDELLIIKKNTMSIVSSEMGLKFKESDVLGKFKITNVDERVASGNILNNSFFDMVNPGDNVIYPPKKEKKAPQKVEKNKGFLNKIFGL